MLFFFIFSVTSEIYTSVLPDVARKAAEDVATLIIAAGCLIPGTTRPRQPERPGHRGTRWQSSASRAHPGRQVSRPWRKDPDLNRNRLSGTVPKWRRNAHTMQQSALGHIGHPALSSSGTPAIPRPTSAHTGLEMKTTWSSNTPGQNGCAAGTRTPNPRIKSPLLSSLAPRYYLRLHARTSEDMSLTCKLAYQMMTVTANPYRGIRATMEQSSMGIGLDHYGRGCLGRSSERRSRHRRKVQVSGMADHVSCDRSPAREVGTVGDPCWQRPGALWMIPSRRPRPCRGGSWAGLAQGSPCA